MERKKRAGSEGPHRPETGAQRQLGDFELRREIGRGGMGVVYESWQTSLHRRVAVKVLPPGLGLTAQAVQRFQREAQAAAQLHHTHIVPVYAVGEEASCHYYAMELIEGQPLTEILRDLRRAQASPLLEAAATRIKLESPGVPRPAASSEGETAPADATAAAPARPAPTADKKPHDSSSFSDSASGSRHWFDTVAKLIADVADALHYAHGRGVVHRDVKPGNLLLSSDGRLCVTDFGLAQVAQDPGMTISGSFLGTPAYMSPEQIAAGRIKVDHRTDVYSLGAVLYEVLTLARPFPGEDREQILAGIMTKEPRPPRRINPRVPVDLETICLKALEKDPDRRYATARAMAEDLRAYVQHGLIAARRAGPLHRGAKWARRHPVVTTAALGVAVAAGIAFLFGTWNTGERARRAVADAQVLLGQGEYRKGLARVNAALKMAPGLDEGRRVRAQLLYQTFHFDAAAKEAKQLLERSPDDWIAHATLAASARQGWILDVDVEKEARTVERLAPQSADAFYLRAIVTEDINQRRLLVDKALELDPSHLPALLQRANDLTAWRDFAGAGATAEQILAVRPRSARGRRALAIRSWNAGDVTRAEEEFRKAIALDPEDPITYSMRGLMKAQFRKPEEALAELNRAVELDPNLARTYADRASVLTDLGRAEEAIADARRALQLSPGLTWVHSSLLRSLTQLDDKEGVQRALLTLETTASRHGIPEHRENTYHVIAFARNQLGDQQEALAAAEQAIRARPDSPESYVAHMQIVRQVQGEAAAHADCERLAGLSLTTPDDYQTRADILRWNCRRPDLALADFDRLIALAPQWAAAFEMRGELRSEEGQSEAALSDLSRAIELSPWSAPVLQTRGNALAAMERFGDALEDYDRAIALGMDTSDIRWSQAEALIRLGRGAEALGVLDKAQWPNPAVRWSRRASALKTLGRLDEALAAADSAVRIRPSGAWNYVTRAMISAFLPGRCASTAADHRKAVELAPEDVDLGSRVANRSAAYAAAACPEVYDAPLALRLAERASRSDPRSSWYQKTLAFVQYRSGDLARARQSEETALRLLKRPSLEHPTDRFLLAMILAKMGSRDQARAEYERGLRRMERYHPHDPANVFLRDEAASLIGVPVP